jgi:hypothetical protein
MHMQHMLLLIGQMLSYLDGELEARVHGVGGPEPADHGHDPRTPHALHTCHHKIIKRKNGK